MKKMLAIVLMLCLLAPAALGEGTVQEVTWEMMGQLLDELTTLGITGDFYTLDEVAVKFWLPAGMNALELNDEAKENGYIACFMPEDQSCSLTVMYVNMDGMDILSYAQTVQDNGGSEIEIIVLNGLPALTYKFEADDSYDVAFATEAGYILEFSMTPASAENAENVWGLVGASIQAAE